MTKSSNRNPAVLYDQIRKDLAAHYPALHLFTESGAAAEVRGTFPILGEGGRVLDSFQVKIKLPTGYPRELPITWETGGRIPWISDRHVEPDGKACVLLPDERWWVFPVDAPFLQYLRGPLHSFFLGQIVVAATGKWPFGEWGHGAAGIIQFYQQRLGTCDSWKIAKYLHVLASARLELAVQCPCSSGKRLGACCRDLILDLRRKIDRSSLERSLSRLEQDATMIQLVGKLCSRSGPPALLSEYAGRAAALSSIHY